jgi:hypothetical protein
LASRFAVAGKAFGTMNWVAACNAWSFDHGLLALH